MPHSAKDIFDYSIESAHHFMTLYDILHDTRARRGRQDWMRKFKNLMHWPSGEKIIRIDGKDTNSVLLIRESVGIDRYHFTHEYTSELLRSALASAVASLDRYFHDLIALSSWKLLSHKDSDIPKALRNLRLPVGATKKALETLRKNRSARPGNLIKAEIQKVLHREHTFQSPSSLTSAAKMLGIDDFWRKVAKEMPNRTKSIDIQNKLREIAIRRNQIVHESDVILKTSAKEIASRDIKRTDVQESLDYICSFISAVEIVVNQ